MPSSTKLAAAAARIAAPAARVALAATLALTSVTLPAMIAPAPAVAATGLDVTANGVPANGSNVTSQIQSLLNSGRTNLYFPAGTYTFTGVSVPANAQITFAPGAVINPAYVGSFLQVNGANVSITGGDFRGNNIDQIAIMANGSASGLVVDGTKASNMQAVVNLVGPSNVTVKNTNSQYNVYGLVISGSSYVTASGNYSYGNLRDGIIGYSGAHHLTITGNTVDNWASRGDHGRAGLHFYGTWDVNVYGNTVKNGNVDAEGIRFRDTERFDCYNNDVTNTGGSGIAVISIGDWYNVNGMIGGNGTIRGNRITGAKLRGINAAYRNPREQNTGLLIKPIKVYDNVITNTTVNTAYYPYDTGDGIIVYMDGSTIVNNTINGATGSGIRTGANNVLIAENKISNVGTVAMGNRSGVLTQLSNNTVVRNTITNAGGWGIFGLGSVFQEGNTISGTTYGNLNLSGGAAGRLAGDATAPSAATDIASTYAASSSVFKLTGSDANSGLAGIMCKVDSGAWHVHQSGDTMGVGAAGSHTVAYYGIDRAGNASPVTTKSYTVGTGTGTTPTPTPTTTPDPTPVPTTTPTPTPSVPTAPSALKATVKGATQVDLAWTAPGSTATSVRVERSWTANGPWTAITTEYANTTTYSDTQVNTGQTYYYRVVAANAAGDSAPSNVVSATPAAIVTAPTTPATPTVAAPTAMAGTAAAQANGQLVTLSWADNATNESGYVLERAYLNGTSQDAWVEIDELAAGSNGYLDLIPLNTAYVYRVRAYTVFNGQRVYSGYAASAKVGSGPVVVPTAPNAPTSLTVRRSLRRFLLNWSDNATNELGYEIWRNEGGVWVLEAKVGANTTAYRTPRLVNATLQYRVRAFNAAGGSAWSNTVTAVMN